MKIIFYCPVLSYRIGKFIEISKRGYEISCKFSNHLFEDKEAKVIIETKREKDIFCLSLCLDCLQALVNGLKYISPDNSYYYDEAHDLRYAV